MEQLTCPTSMRSAWKVLPTRFTTVTCCRLQEAQPKPSTYSWLQTFLGFIAPTHRKPFHQSSTQSVTSRKTNVSLYFHDAHALTSPNVHGSCMQNAHPSYKADSVLKMMMSQPIEYIYAQAAKRFAKSGEPPIQLMQDACWHLNHFPNVETRFHCLQAFLSLDSRCTMDLSEFR